MASATLAVYLPKGMVKPVTRLAKDCVDGTPEILGKLPSVPQGDANTPRRGHSSYRGNLRACEGCAAADLLLLAFLSQFSGVGNNSKQ